MRVAITGASGFVGSFVLKSLIEQGQHEVAVLGRHPQTAWRIAHYLGRVLWIHAELDDPKTYSARLHEFAPEAVLHLAWAGVGSADRNSLIQFRSLTSSLHLLEQSISAGCQHWVGLGSQAEYGPCKSRVAEDHATAPTTLYGESKLAAYRLMSMHCKHANIRFAWLRLFSSFGPTDSPQWMIPYLITQLHRQERPALTLGEQLWDYVFVADAAKAIHSVLDTHHASGLFNLGSGQVIKLRHFIEKIRNQINPDLPLGLGEIAYRPDQVMHLEADITRLTNLTGWKPQTPIDEAIKTTVQWYTQARN